MHTLTIKSKALISGLAILALPFLLNAKELSTEENSTKNFFREPEFTDASLSPDGEKIAFVATREGTDVVSILRVSDKSILGRWNYGKGLRVAKVHWAGNTRTVARVGAFSFEFGYFNFPGTLVAQDIDGKRPRGIEQGELYRIINFPDSEDGKLLVERSGKNSSLGFLDTRTGKFKASFPAPIPNASFVVDKAGNPQFSSGINKNGILEQFEYKNNTWNLLDSSSVNQLSSTPIGLADDGSSILIKVTEGGEPDKIISYNMQDDSEKEVSSDQDSDPTELLLGSDGQTLLGVRYDPHKAVYDILRQDLSEGKTVLSLLQAFGDLTVTISGISRDGKKILIKVFSDTTPGDYYLVDSTKNKATLLLSARPWIDPKLMSKSTPIRFKSTDGASILGYITTPLGQSAKMLPLVVITHQGVIGSRVYWGFDPQVQYLASLGYAVLQVNFRGSSGFGQAFNIAANRHWDSLVPDDILSGVKYLASNGIADASKVCILGYSIGAHTAFATVMRSPKTFRCAIGNTGIYDLPLLVKNRVLASSEAAPIKSALLQLIPETEAEQKTQSPAFNAGKIPTATLFIQGVSLFAPNAQLDTMVRALEKTNNPPDKVIYDKRRPTDSGSKNIGIEVEIQMQIADFLKKHIPPKTIQ